MNKNLIASSERRIPNLATEAQKSAALWDKQIADAWSRFFISGIGGLSPGQLYIIENTQRPGGDPLEKDQKAFEARFPMRNWSGY